MAYSSIAKPTDYFNTKLYTGNSSTQAITGVGFQPDWVWIKDRSETSSHEIFDAVRGVTKTINYTSLKMEHFKIAEFQHQGQQEQVQFLLQVV